MDLPTLPEKKTVKELELEAMKYEYIMEYHMKQYFKSLDKQGSSTSGDKEALSRAIRASKKANKNWTKVALLSRPWPE